VFELIWTFPFAFNESSTPLMTFFTLLVALE